MIKKIILISLILLFIIAGVVFGLNVIKYKSSPDKISEFPDISPATIKKDGPNILFITIDTLRADHVGCYGYTRDTTPNIDKVAQESVKFTQLIGASSWTMPTHMSMFTSLYPSVHKTTDYKKKLDEDIITLAEVLKNNGYRTIAFVSNPTLSGKYGFDQGFDFYDDFSVVFDFELNLFEQQDIDNLSARNARTSPIVNQITINWLKNNYDKGSFFMFVHYFDPHYDYLPPPPYDTMFDPDYKGSMTGDNIMGNKAIAPGMNPRDLEHIIALYDGEIRYTDNYVGLLIDKFKELGIWDNTILVLLSDHGDEFLEHGGKGHGPTVYEELIRVPLVIRYPKKIPPNLSINTQVSQIDLMPTILELLDITPPKAIQGLSLMPLVRGEQRSNSVVYCERDNRLPLMVKAIRTPRFKLIYNKENNQIKDKEFYNLEQDPGELANLMDSDTEQSKVMDKKLSGFFDLSEKLAIDLRTSDKDNKIVLDEDTKRRLRALGYLQ